MHSLPKEETPLTVAVNTGGQGSIIENSDPKNQYYWKLYFSDCKSHSCEKVRKEGNYWEEQILPIYWLWRQKSKSLFLTGKMFVQFLKIWTILNEIYQFKYQPDTWGADSVDILAVKTEEQEPISDWKDVCSIFANLKYFELNFEGEWGTFVQFFCKFEIFWLKYSSNINLRGRFCRCIGCEDRRARACF